MNESRIQLTGLIPDTLTDARLDVALARLFPDYSRAKLSGWIKSGNVKVDDTVITKQRTAVLEGQHIVIDALLPKAVTSAAQDIPLDIVYEDDTLIVINKPVGLVVHPGAGNPDETLLNALVHHDPALAQLPRAGIVHRLDKDTSGLLVIAKTLPAHHHLLKQLQDRSMQREYLTVVFGEFISGGDIDAPIGRHPKHRIKMAVVPGGKTAITHYRIEERFRSHTLLRVKLETGRTHQIRVHFAHIHHPVVGDPVYGRRFTSAKKIGEALRDALKIFKRQALHACRLTLLHPETNDVVCVEAPVPEDLQTLIEAMRHDATQ